MRDNFHFVGNLSEEAIFLSKSPVEITSCCFLGYESADTSLSRSKLHTCLIPKTHMRLLHKTAAQNRSSAFGRNGLLILYER